MQEMPAEHYRPDDGCADRRDEDSRGSQILRVSSQRMKLRLKQVDGMLDGGVQGLSAQDQGNCCDEDEPLNRTNLKIEPQHDRNQRDNEVNPKIPLG